MMCGSKGLNSRGGSYGKERVRPLTTEFGTCMLSAAKLQGGRNVCPRAAVHALLCFSVVSFVAHSTDIWSDKGFRISGTVRAQKLCNPPQTILISIDGFRFDYLHRRYNQLSDGNTSLIAPSLVKIAQEGAFSYGGMIPVMPSITFPNHWSIATGLYPESSGIVHNVMYDPERRKLFRYNGDDPSWWHGEPIWKTVSRTKRGSVNFTSAAVFWPGSSVPTLSADVFWTYNGSVSYEDRVNRVVSVLKGTAEDMKGKRVDFVTLYFEGVDTAGHYAGPNSKHVERAIAKVDEALVNLFRQLGPNYTEKYNVVIVSDHGMAETRPDTAIDLDAIVAPGTLQDVVSSPFGMFISIGISAQRAYKTIRRGLKRYAPHAKAYLQADLPERWHVKKAKVMTPIVTLATPGFWFRYKHKKFIPMRQAIRRVRGAHGYEHTAPEMRAIFMAIGPSFNRRSRIPLLEAVDIYPMLCSIFGTRPAPNNGSYVKTKALLSECAAKTSISIVDLKLREDFSKI